MNLPFLLELGHLTSTVLRYGHSWFLGFHTFTGTYIIGSPTWFSILVFHWNYPSSFLGPPDCRWQVRRHFSLHNCVSQALIINLCLHLDICISYFFFASRTLTNINIKSYYRWRSKGTKQLSNLLKSTELVSGRASIWTQALWLKTIYSDSSRVKNFWLNFSGIVKIRSQVYYDIGYSIKSALKYDYCW